MYIEARKIHIIEEVLKLNNEDVLIELETVFRRSQKGKKYKQSIYDFVGVLNNKEVAQMKKAISETCENVNEDDWK